MLTRDRQESRAGQRITRTRRASRSILPVLATNALAYGTPSPSKTARYVEALGLVHGLTPESQRTELARAQWLLDNVGTPPVSLEWLFGYLLEADQPETYYYDVDQDVEVESPPAMPPLSTRTVRVRVLGRERVEPSTISPAIDLPPPGD